MPSARFGWPAVYPKLLRTPLSQRNKTGSRPDNRGLLGVARDPTDVIDIRRIEAVASRSMRPLPPSGLMLLSFAESTSTPVE
jgi:hypothetical protein